MAVSCRQVANHVLLQARDIAAHAHDGSFRGSMKEKTIRDVRSRVSLIVLQQMYNMMKRPLPLFQECSRLHLATLLRRGEVVDDQMGCVVCEQTDGQPFDDGKEKAYELGIVEHGGDG